jgi:hypothetical protein
LKNNQIALTLILAMSTPFLCGCAVRSVRDVSGWWEVDPHGPEAGVRWVIVRPGSTADGPPELEWPTGIGCQTEYGDYRERVLTIRGKNFPVIVRFQDRRTATMEFQGDANANVFRLRKTKDTIGVVCE